ncbi:hypothetical protein QN277_026971 [Acacia crassicarpa]|uniref:Uncharacterized protein n=1 Tax=Acacia crassicarpa TaxID=499986 RepID=A0AAE1JCG2_9FABA|nr:hypothetical protein QN277_026971 [Acacia crassicarpa]
MIGACYSLCKFFGFHGRQ